MNTLHLKAMPEDWRMIADVFSALGEETRQKILLLFEPGERIGRKTLTELLPLSATAVTHHVTTLVRAGLLIPSKTGRDVSYSLNSERLLECLDRVRDYVAELRHEELRLRAAREAREEAREF